MGDKSIQDSSAHGNLQKVWTFGWQDWLFVTEDTYSLFLKLKSSYPHIVKENVFALFRANGSLGNPHRSAFGQAFLILPWINRNLFWMGSLSMPRLKASEAKKILECVPGFNRLYRLTTEGTSWQIKFKSKFSKTRESDWTNQKWRLVLGEDPKKAIALTGRQFFFLSQLLPKINQGLSPFELNKNLGGKKLPKNTLEFLKSNHAIRQSSPPSLRSRKEPKLKFFGHASVLIETVQTQILIDPVLFLPRNRRGLKNRSGMTALSEALRTAKVVLITHSHPDHFSLQTLLRLDRLTQIIIPKIKETGIYRNPHNPPLRDVLESFGFSNVSELGWNESIQIKDCKIEAFPFYGEWSGPHSDFDGNTYLVQPAGKRIFFSADAHRDGRGDMITIFKKYQNRLKDVDVLFSGSSHLRIEHPLLTGSPYLYSNHFYRFFKSSKQTGVDHASLLKWCKLLRPKQVVPYASLKLDLRDENAPLSSEKRESMRRLSRMLGDEGFPVNQVKPGQTIYF